MQTMHECETGQSMESTPDLQTEDLSSYQVSTRREIVALLRNIGEQKQFISMRGNCKEVAIVTSILKVDVDAGSVILDCAQSERVNEQILSSDNLSFETALEQIRIVFFSKYVAQCVYEGEPALVIPLPESLTRLQRREFYRVPTPLVNPASCTITIPQPGDDEPCSVTIVLQNVSGGGIALIDEHGALDQTIGRVYRNCRIDLPGGTLVVASLQLRNAQKVRLANGKHVWRLGCLFIDLPHTTLAAVQRYITKLEHEQNARLAGRVP
ncbi:MAG: flagellar brake protein [Burkholderiaceae bacterium]